MNEAMGNMGEQGPAGLADQVKNADVNQINAALGGLGLGSMSQEDLNNLGNMDFSQMGNMDFSQMGNMMGNMFGDPANMANFQ